LIAIGLLLFRSALADSEKFYCDFDSHRIFSCQKSVLTATSQPLSIKEKDGSTFYITPQIQLGLDGAEYRFLTLRAKAKTDFPRFKINFSDRAAGILTLNNFAFKNNNQFTDYYFNLSLFDQWGGTIDRLYLQFVPQDLEIDSFRLSIATPTLVIKSLWQEFWTERPEFVPGINGLNTPLLSGVPFIKYIFALTLIVVVILAIFKYRDQGLAKRWPQILLIIFLVSWLSVAIRTLYSSYLSYLNDRSLRFMAPSIRAEKAVGDLIGSPEQAKNLYSFLAIVKNNVPLGATIFIPPSDSYTYVRLIYDLADQYQVVGDINKASYLLLFEQSLPASTQDFKLKFSAPNQLIYQR